MKAAPASCERHSYAYAHRISQPCMLLASISPINPYIIACSATPTSTLRARPPKRACQDPAIATTTSPLTHTVVPRAIHPPGAHPPGAHTRAPPIATPEGTSPSSFALLVSLSLPRTRTDPSAQRPQHRAAILQCRRAATGPSCRRFTPARVLNCAYSCPSTSPDHPYTDTRPPPISISPTARPLSQPAARLVRETVFE